MANGYLALVLHAHLPFVRHPEYESFLEENWLFEAVTDTYIPIINVFDGLIDDGVDFRVTLSLSPTLISMLRDELLVSRYLRHLDKLISISGMEAERTRSDEKLNKLAVMYHDRYQDAKYVFSEKYGSNIIRAFKKFRDLGKMEIITSCGTHGYLPFMDLYPSAVKAQIKAAVDTYKTAFGDIPKGLWLPECGYQPGHDEIFKEFGIRYFFTEAHGVLYGTPKPKCGVYSPYLCGSGVAVFGRDLESSKAVWSAKEGYPGNHNYREYYSDIGVNTGIKYHRVTGGTEQKDIYDRELALETALRDAEDFLSGRKKQAEHLSGTMERSPVIVSPYDAELFGHWWFEGPEWIGFLFRKIDLSRDAIKAITPGEYLDLYDDYPPITPSMSSWGYKGYSEIWLDGSNDWIYRHLHKMTELMSEAVRDYAAPQELEKRVLGQMGRDLLLAQSSDWAFIMKTGTFRDYAVKRSREHIGRFLALHDQLRNGNIDIEMLEEAERKYNLFKDIDYKIYA